MPCTPSSALSCATRSKSSSSLISTGSLCSRLSKPTRSQARRLFLTQPAPKPDNRRRGAIDPGPAHFPEKISPPRELVKAESPRADALSAARKGKSGANGAEPDPLPVVFLKKRMDADVENCHRSICK